MNIIRPTLKKSILVLAVVLLFVFAALPSISIAFCVDVTSVFAIQAAGSTSHEDAADGSGDNRTIQLTLESSSIANESTGVSLTPIIQLTFNKNICNVLVLPNNKTCFHLTEAGGGSVAIRLIFPDDQIQQDYKRQAFIIPKEPLSPETEYRISVDKTLKAKNGSFIDDAHNITFTTGSQSAKSSNKILEALNDATIIYETASGENADSIPLQSNPDEPVISDGLSINAIAIIVAIIIIAVIIAASIFLMRHRNHNSKL